MIKRIDRPQWYSSVTETSYDDEISALRAEQQAELAKLKEYHLDQYVWTANAATAANKLPEFNLRERHIKNALIDNPATAYECLWSMSKTLNEYVGGKAHLVLLINLDSMPIEKYVDLEFFLSMFYPHLITAYRGWMEIVSGLTAFYSENPTDRRPSYKAPLRHLETVLMMQHRHQFSFLVDYKLIGEK